ncbi:MAG TPA: hypothetical protein VHX37_09610 [Acidobacteriaceae bacterium]|jgi:hypothetical protein|nr:hypothetical protein [Acidobacteriaceae bacterium]
MASTTAFAGERIESDTGRAALRSAVFTSIERLVHWLRANDYQGYDTFDGLNARWVRPLTFETRLGRTILQQGIRRFPMNLRPLLGVRKGYSSKGMGFLARGFIRLHSATQAPEWAEEAERALEWLMAHPSPGYSGACWGNHFDYQSRGFYLPRGMPTVVWTSLIGHAFLDAWDHFGREQYLQMAVSACTSVLRDLTRIPDGTGTCISYIPGLDCQVHNANTLGGSLLARTWLHTGTEEYREVARQALAYTAQYQRPDGSWWYGEREDMHWVDNFHTAYVLDCFRYYAAATRDDSFGETMERGYRYWKETFFLPDGTPKYYDRKVLPLDIQCCSQAIDTLVLFSERDPESLALAGKVTLWTLRNMQGGDGHFYYRRYNPWLVNKTATLHWGQATMLSALAGLYQKLSQDERAR